MIEYQGKLPEGALLSSLGKAASLKPAVLRSEEALAQNISDTKNVASDSSDYAYIANESEVECNAHGRVDRWGRAAQKLERTESNQAGTIFEAGVGLQFEASKNTGFHGEHFVQNAHKLSLAMVYSRALQSPPLTVFGIDLDKAKTWMSLVDFGDHFALAEKKVETKYAGRDVGAIPSPILLEMEIEGQLTRLYINGELHSELEFANQGWGGAGDLFIGARNHNAGPANRLGTFFLHGFWLKNNANVITKPDQDWRDAIQTYWNDLKNDI